MWRAVLVLQSILGREVAIKAVSQKSGWKLVKQNIVTKFVCPNPQPFYWHRKLQRYKGTANLLAYGSKLTVRLVLLRSTHPCKKKETFLPV